MTRAPLLWFGVLAAPLAWAAQLVAAYGMEEAACSIGTRGALGGHAGGAMLATTLVAAAVALAGGASAGLVWLGARDGDDHRGRVGFLSLLGLIASGLFLAAILLAAADVLALDPCRQS